MSDERLPDKLTLAWSVPLVAGLLTWFAWPSWWTLVDDAYISARYSELFAHGHGIVYNAGEPPVEGVTNLAWTVLVGLARVVGLPIAGTMTTLGWLFSVLAVTGLLFLGHSLARGPSRRLAGPLAGALMACEPHLAVATTNGLESSMMVAAVVWATWAAVTLQGRARWAAGALIALLPWVRPEGLAVVAGLTVFAAGQAYFQADDRRPATLVRYATPLVAPALASAAVLFTWRLATYGLLLPNTYYAKVAFPLEESWQVNDQYLKPEAATFYGLIPAFLVASLAPPYRWSRTIVACLALGLALIPLTVYLWMPGLRLFLPTMALTAALVASTVALLPKLPARLATAALLLLMIGFQRDQAPRIQNYDSKHSVLPDNGAQRAAEHLAAHAPEGAWLATRDAGVLAYFVGPHIKVAELHQRALTQPHPDGDNAHILEYTPTDPTFFISTVQRDKADTLAYGNDKRVFHRMKADYTYLGRVRQHYHRFYDIYVRDDAKIPPLPKDLVVNRKGPLHPSAKK